MRENGSDDPADQLTKREKLATQIVRDALDKLDLNDPRAASTTNTKHIAFMAASAAKALFDELAKED